jgi:predicted metal-dependent HD superfamily phosphohydrolase
MPPALRDRWHDLCARIGAFGRAEESDLTFDMISSMYSHPPREYHNLEHIAHCLHEFDDVRGLADDKDAVEFALWLHDSIYFAERSDNEERSADAASMIAGLLGAPPGFAENVRGLIAVTRHSLAPGRGDPALVADIDLAILAAPEPEYDEYALAIRREFAFADDELFRGGRIAFLHRMLDKDDIYATPFFKRDRERKARLNMDRERRSLGG